MGKMPQRLNSLTLQQRATAALAKKNYLMETFMLLVFLRVLVAPCRIFLKIAILTKKRFMSIWEEPDLEAET